MKKNDYIEVECIDYSHDGQGIAKKDGFPIFVKNMLVGERGTVKLVKILKNYAIGRLIDIKEVSHYRSEPICSLYKTCGGCQLQHLSIEGQQLLKTKRVKDTLERIGHCFVDVQPCLMMNEPWYYRNKVQVPVGYQDDELITGFYKQHSNDIVPMETCFIQNDESNKLVKRVRELLNIHGETAYQKLTHKGNIRHILVKYGNKTNELMLVFITNYKDIKNINDIVKKLKNEFPHLKTIIQNINRRHDNVILGDEIIILSGNGYIEDELLGNKYRISAKSFYQVNPIQVEHLYKKAIHIADLKKTDVVVDAYCGIGTISLSLAPFVQHVYGVEIVEQAIRDAKDNAKRNDIDNVEFFCKDAGDFMIGLAKTEKNIDIVMVDPPRKGCSLVFLEQLITLSPCKIIYISCDVATQARDVAYLQDNGYKVDYCQPVDMFPQTHNIENIVRFIKDDSND